MANPSSAARVFLVELVLRRLGAGMSPDAILADHPRLRPEDILAAQAFAADYLADEEIIYRRTCAGLQTNALLRPWLLFYAA